MPIKNGRVYVSVNCGCGKEVVVSSGDFGTYCTNCGRPIFAASYNEQLNVEIRNVVKAERLKMRKERKGHPPVEDYSVGSSALIKTCANCGGNLSAGGLYIVDGEPICKVCYETKIPRCKGCNERHFPQYLKKGLCEGCIVSFATCKNCGTVYDKRKTHEFELEGKSFCENCVPRYLEAKGVRFNGYSHKPKPVFLGEKEDLVFYGVELETDNSQRRSELMARAHCDEIYFKSDGSLGPGGVEIVSHPATLKYHMNEFPWKNILSSAKICGYKSHTGVSGDRHSNHPTCGLHIHVNKEAFGRTTSERDTREAKLLVLVDKFWNKLVIFSRRDKRSLENWARRYADFDVTNDQLSDIISKAKSENSRDRRLAVNFGANNSATVEFRMFRGTLNYETLIATIQLIDLLVEMSKLPTKKVQAMTWDEFCEEGSKYEEFTGYLTRLRGMKRDI